MGKIRYFRTDPALKSPFPQFAAVSNDLVSENPTVIEPAHPYAIMGLATTKRRFIPNFGEGEASHPFYKGAKALGVHPDYLRHLYEEGHGNGEDGYNTELADSIRQTRSTLPKEDWQQSIDWLKDQPELNPDTLFTEVEPTTRVSSFFSHSSMTAPAMTLGALAMNATGVDKLIADEDLSPYSSRLAEHGKRLGIVEAHRDNPYMDATNNFDFDDEAHTIHPDDYSVNPGGHAIVGHQRMVEIPEHEVSEARKTMKQVLRGTRQAPSTPAPKQHMSAQFDHPKLPGLEGF